MSEFDINAVEGVLRAGDTLNVPCPSCGEVAERTVYDIGSGPELSCANCEWCWGAAGQSLKPLSYQEIVQQIGFDPLSRITSQRQQAVDEDPGPRERPLITLTPQTTMVIGPDGIVVNLTGLDVKDDLGIGQDVDLRQDADLMRGRVKDISPTGFLFIDVDWKDPTAPPA